MRVVWLAPFPIHLLSFKLDLVRMPGTGHPSSWIVTQLDGLAKTGQLDLHLVTGSPWIRQSQTLEHRGITQHWVKTGPPLVHKGFPRCFPLDLWTGFRGEARALARAVLRLRPDLVHAHGTEGPWARTARDLPFPSLISVQGLMTEMERIHPCHRYRRLASLETDILGSSQHILAQSQFVLDRVRRLNPHAHVARVPLPVDPRFSLLNTEIERSSDLLTVSALRPGKGLFAWLDAFADLRKHTNMGHLHMVGDGPLRQALQRHAQKRAMGDQVIWHGQLDPEAIMVLMEKVRLFVLPSRMETFGMSVAEAMTAGLPVVARGVAALTELIQHGRNGWLFQGEQDALAAAVRTVHADGCLARRLGDHARQVFQDHDPSRTSPQLLTLYRQITQAP